MILLIKTSTVCVCAHSTLVTVHCVCAQASPPCCSWSQRWWRIPRTRPCVTCCLPTRSVSSVDCMVVYVTLRKRALTCSSSSCPATDGEGHPAEGRAGGDPGQQPGALQAVVHCGQSSWRSVERLHSEELQLLHSKSPKPHLELFQVQKWSVSMWE